MLAKAIVRPTPPLNKLESDYGAHVVSKAGRVRCLDGGTLNRSTNLSTVRESQVVS